MTYEKNTKIEMLRRLYLGKCGQLNKAKASSNTLRFQVLKIEAEAIKAEMNMS